MPSQSDSEDFRKQSGQSIPIPIQKFPQFSSILTGKNNAQRDEHKKLDAEFDEWRKSLAISVVTSIDETLAGGPGGASGGGGTGSSGGSNRGPKGDKGDKGDTGPPGGVLPGGFFEVAAVGNAAGAETALLAAVIPSGTIGVDGELFFIDAFGSFGPVVSTDKRIRLKFGPTTIYDTFNLTGVENLKWHLGVMILRISATTQIASVQQVGFPAQVYDTSEDLDNADISVVLTGAGTNVNDVVTAAWKGRVVL